MVFLNGFILLFQASISSYLCDNCTKLLALENNIKIGVCPTDYRLNGLICEKDYPYNIYIRFNDYIDFSNQDIYGLLKVPSGTFLTPGNPFPTKERGFYFPKNSYMICNKSLIPSPILSFQFHIRVFDNGIIFSIEGKNPYLQLLGKELISLNYRYCGINRLCDLAEKIIEYQYPNKAKIQWIHILININESEIGIEMILFLNLVEELRLLLDGENAIGIFDIYEEFYFTVGSEFEGFSGFIYSFEFSFKYYELYYYNFENVNNCDPYFYAENNKCYQTNCTNLSNIWSVREECSVCYTNKCFNCSNYYNSECFIYQSDSEIGCTKFTSFNCEVCDNYYFKINNGTNTYCSFEIEFSLLKNYPEAHIISGNNKNTDSKNNPDPDDPIFTVGRGYYFNGDAFLTTQSSFIIPYSSVINMWVLPISGSIFSKGSILETIYNETSKQLITYISFESNEEFTSSLKKLEFDVVGSEWFSYIIAWSNYYNGIIFHGTQYNKNTFPVKNEMFIDDLENQFFLGKGSIGFTGFIAHFTIQNYFYSFNLNHIDWYNFFIQNYRISSLYGLNLNSCYESVTMLCNITCENCDKCMDSSIGLCFECPLGTYYDEVTCAGLETKNGYSTYKGTLYPNRGSCSLSFKGLECSSCYSPFVLYENLCISSCPSGYKNNSNICIFEYYEVLSFFSNNSLNVSILGNISLGNSNLEYPDIDSNDPIPVYNRGYYFKSNSYMKTNQVTLGPRFKISAWIFFYTYGQIIKKYNSITTKNLKMYSYDYCNHILSVSTLFDQTDLYHSAGCLNEHRWKYIYFSISYDSKSLLTRIFFYIDNFHNLRYLENDFFEDNESIDLIFGSDINDGFIGFIYMLKIYNKDDISDIFIENLFEEIPYERPIPCDFASFNEYPSIYNISCSYCSEDCINGCVRASDCTLCIEKLCQSCLSFESKCSTCKSGAEINLQGICECKTSYFENITLNECIRCSDNCLKCNGPDNKDCFQCIPGYKFFTNFQECIPAETCPGIDPADSDNCTLTDTLLIYSEFKSFSSIFIDDLNKILFDASSNPWLIPGRGLYFNGSNFLEMDKENHFKFGPEFSISMWAKVYDSGSLFIREDQNILIDLQVQYASSLSFLNAMNHEYIEKISIQLIPFAIDTWILYQYFVGSSKSNLDFSSEYKSVYTRLYFDWFKDTVNVSNTFIGKIKGFIWNIEIYNFLYKVNENSVGGPATISGILSECGILEYGDNCTDCPDFCTSGCRRSENCEMCHNPLCKKCITEFTCIECSSGYYIDSGICEACPKDCSSCNSSTFCTECISKNTDHLKGKCRCKDGYFNETFLHFSNSCLECDKSCSKCTSLKTCESCSDENAKLDKFFNCVCKAGLYFNQFNSKCENCHRDCETCTDYSSCTLCKKENSQLSPAGRCECDEGYFEDFDNCVKCGIECFSCKDEETCTSCRDINKELNDGKCYCKKGWFKVSDKFICSPCIFPCEDCISENICLSCKENSELKDKKCTCSYGFHLSKYGCIKFDSIQMKFKEGFLKIDVEFSRVMKKVTIGQVFGSEKYDKIFGKGSFLEQSDDDKFVLYLGRNYSKSLDKEMIDINCLDLEKESFVCEKNYKVGIKRDDDFPKPLAKVLGVNAVNLTCDTRLLLDGRLSEGGLNYELKYKWISDKNKVFNNNSLVELDSEQISNIFSLSDNFINFTLQVENIYNKSSFEGKAIKILSKSSFYVGIESSYKFNCFYSQTCEFFILRTFACLNISNIRFEWYQLKDNSKTCEKAIKNCLKLNNEKASLVIISKSLKPSPIPFKFQVKALNSKGEEEASKDLEITILREKPLIVLERSFGDASRLEDLVMNASLSMNPNDDSSLLRFSWKAVADDYIRLPPIIENRPVLIISKESLVNIDNFFISLQVCDNEFLCSFINGSIRMIDFPVPKVKITEHFSKTLPNRIPTQKKTTFDGEIYSFFMIKSIKWTLNSNKTLLSSSSTVTLSGLVSGMTQNLKLYLKYLNYEVEFILSFKTNKPPDSGSLLVDPASGKELETIFTFLALDWRDDEEDYPLIYEFGYRNDRKSVSFIYQQQNIYFTELYALGEDIKATLIVYDSLGDFVNIETEFWIFQSISDSAEVFSKTLNKIILDHNLPVIVSNFFQLIALNQTAQAGLKLEVFGFALESIQIYVNNSIANEFLIAQVIEIFKMMVLPQEFFNAQKSFESGMAQTEEEADQESFERSLAVVGLINGFLEKVDEIGLTESRGSLLLNCLDAVYTSASLDLYSSQGSELTFEITKTINQISTLVIKTKNTTSTFNSSNISVQVSIITPEDLNNLIFGQADHPVFFTNLSKTLNKPQEIFSITTGVINAENDIVLVSLFSVDNRSEVKVKQGASSVFVGVSDDLNGEGCFYMDSSNKTYQEGRCEMVKKNQMFYCECDSAVISSEFSITFSLPSLKNFKSPDQIEFSGKKPGVYVSYSFFFVYFLIVLICWNLDFRERKNDMNINTIGFQNQKDNLDYTFYENQGYLSKEYSNFPNFDNPKAHNKTDIDSSRNEIMSSNIDFETCHEDDQHFYSHSSYQDQTLETNKEPTTTNSKWDLKGFIIKFTLVNVFIKEEYIQELTGKEMIERKKSNVKTRFFKCLKLALRAFIDMFWVSLYCDQTIDTKNSRDIILRVLSSNFLQLLFSVGVGEVIGISFRYFSSKSVFLKAPLLVVSFVSVIGTKTYIDMGMSMEKSKFTALAIIFCVLLESTFIDFFIEIVKKCLIIRIFRPLFTYLKSKILGICCSPEIEVCHQPDPVIY